PPPRTRSVRIATPVRPRPVVTTFGSMNTSVSAPFGPALVTNTFSTAAATFVDGDRLQLEVQANGDCNASLSYDGATAASKLSVAMIVSEGLAGLLLLAPALPLAARWWKRRR